MFLGVAANQTKYKKRKVKGYVHYEKRVRKQSSGVKKFENYERRA